MGPHAAKQLPDGDPTSVLRRAPSPTTLGWAPGVSAPTSASSKRRSVFGEEGYHQCGVIRITEVAGCSRAAFYQYFSSKEDVFRHLAGQVARQLVASAEALGPITGGPRRLADPAGLGRAPRRDLRPLRAGVRGTPGGGRERRPSPAGPRIADRTVADVRAKLTTSVLPSRQLDEAIGILLECMTRARGSPGSSTPAGTVPSGAPPIPSPRRRRHHRHRAPERGRPARSRRERPPSAKRRPHPRMGPVMLEGLQPDDGADDLGPPAPAPCRRSWPPATTCWWPGAITARGSTTSPRRPRSPTAPSIATSTTRTT